MHRHVAIVLDRIRHIEPLNLPRVAKQQPVVRLLVLEPRLDALAEHSVLVPDAVAPRGQVGGGHGVEEASCQAAEAAVAERRVSLLHKNANL